MISIVRIKSLLLVALFVFVRCETTTAQQSSPIDQTELSTESESPAAPEIASEIAKWEGAIAKLEQRNAEEDHPSNRILFCGSSSIRLWRTIAEDMSPWPVIQRGYGGAKLPDFIHYASRVIGPHLGTDNPKRCRALVIFVANDITGRETDGTPQEVTGRFSKLHNWIRSLDATLPVFWIEVTPSNSRWKVWSQIDESTKLIGRVIDADANAHLISTAGAYLGVDGLPRPELFRKDQLHLTPAGYKQWAILIKARLHAKLGATDPLVIVPEETEAPVLEATSK